MEEETKELVEISIESPIRIRKAHRRERMNWIKRQRARDRTIQENVVKRIVRHKKRINGICTKCGCENKALEGRTICKYHLEKEMKYRRDKSSCRKKWKQEKLEKGICTRKGCKNVAENMRRICKTHIESAFKWYKRK